MSGDGDPRTRARLLQALLGLVALGLPALGFASGVLRLVDGSASLVAGVSALTSGVVALAAGVGPGTSSAVHAPEGFLRYRGYRFLWLFLGLSVWSIGVFTLDAPREGRSGSSWLGYGIGTICAVGMLWLLWFGVRKRSYFARGASLRAWLSAHVYLGLALLVLIPLHSAFEFGANLHTLAMALAFLAVGSGIAGLGFYVRVPTDMTRNRPGQKLEAIFKEIAVLDARCKKAVRRLPDAYAGIVERAIDETRIGGGMFRQLAGYREGATARAIRQIRASDPLRGESAERRLEIREILEVKQRLLQRVGRDVQLKALLDLWLLIHIPSAVGAVVAVALHVFSIFYYR